MSFVDASPASTQILTQTSHSASLQYHYESSLNLKLVQEHAQTLDLELERQEEDLIFSARSCFDTREFHQAAHLLKDCQSPKGTFLRLYSQFIVSQREPFILLHQRCTHFQGIRKAI